MFVYVMHGSSQNSHKDPLERQNPGWLGYIGDEILPTYI